jgi:putative ATPase
MKNLFTPKPTPPSFVPLADRLRPKTLDDFVGQRHLLGRNKPLYKALKTGSVPSMILWGPPGSGKTTLARLAAVYTKSHFVQFSAVTAGVEEVRKNIAEAKERMKLYGQKTILFIDEIHRFNKAQQDAFLPWVENGTIILIGATTENPSFEVNAPLLSRCQVYVLETLKDEEIAKIAQRGVKEFPKNRFHKAALEHIIRYSDGDARRALNAIELSANLAPKIDIKVAEEALQKKALYYDKKAEYHYDVISAFIKSLRGSNPDAALYWLARMIDAGEDPVFIARRMVIFASEDVGNARPTAQVIATSCMEAVHMVGMPEARIILAQTATYLATCPKDNAAYMGIEEALSDVQKEGELPVPLHLRNAPTDLMKETGYGKGYKYPHSFPGHQVSQEYLPKKLNGKKYYKPRKDL